MSNKITLPELAEGERYVGATVDPEGNLTHVILLPGEKKATWKSALKWAASIGGDLPTRLEQSLMHAHAKDAFEDGDFKADHYWSNSQHASYSGYAWCQYFGSGFQFSFSTGFKLRARAVRRLIIQ